MRKEKRYTNYKIWLVIKEADEGGALVIMNKRFYKEKMVLADHLQDISTYKIVPQNSDIYTMRKLKELTKITKMSYQKRNMITSQIMIGKQANSM